ncbi:MAG: S-layer homology domain-containing protein [Oscillospiraceae bacterium]|nr:S-layer homology domain-containing protein [Clostridia bacterium]MBQ4544374.1 S-layer homology domain-containing protein [Oscillospiraceae bacterium]
MLVCLLGKDSEAKAGTFETPFTDVPAWAEPYVGYAYENKLTSGISATTFGSSATVTSSQYITFILRALGYDSSSDFSWDKAWELSDKIGLTNGRYSEKNSIHKRRCCTHIKKCPCHYL